MAKTKKKEVSTGDKLFELIEGIGSGMDALTEEMDKCMDNASAARRARKLTSELTKQFKEFRAVSVAHFKK